MCYDCCVNRIAAYLAYTGSTPGGAEEIEHGEEEKDAHEKTEEMPDDGQQNASVQNHENHSSENLAITPFKACRFSAARLFITQ